MVDNNHAAEDPSIGVTKRVEEIPYDDGHMGAMAAMMDHEVIPVCQVVNQGSRPLIDEGAGDFDHKPTEVMKDNRGVENDAGKLTFEVESTMLITRLIRVRYPFQCQGGDFWRSSCCSVVKSI